jgi:hypothetical protein
VTVFTDRDGDGLNEFSFHITPDDPRHAALASGTAEGIRSFYDMSAALDVTYSAQELVFDLSPRLNEQIMGSFGGGMVVGATGYGLARWIGDQILRSPADVRAEGVTDGIARTPLYRAIYAEELAALAANGMRFTPSPNGLEVKYFTTTPEAAVRAGTYIGPGRPFTVMMTMYQGMITPSFIDRTPIGPIPSVTVPNGQLHLLSPAVPAR